MSWMDDGGFEMKTVEAYGNQMVRMSFRTLPHDFDILLSKTDVQRIRRECGRSIKELDARKDVK